MDVLDKKLDGDGTWPCEHVTADGIPAPPPRLSVAQAVEEKRAQSTSPRRAWVRCPDCRTHWRVWVDLKIAKPYIEWRQEDRKAAPKLNRSPMLDIDGIVSGVCERMPAVCVSSMHRLFRETMMVFGDSTFPEKRTRSNSNQAPGPVRSSSSTME
jgi:hypothetical protein